MYVLHHQFSMHEIGWANACRNCCRTGLPKLRALLLYRVPIGVCSALMHLTSCSAIAELEDGFTQLPSVGSMISASLGSLITHSSHPHVYKYLDSWTFSCRGQEYENVLRAPTAKDVANLVHLEHARLPTHLPFVQPLGASCLTLTGHLALSSHVTLLPLLP